MNTAGIDPPCSFFTGPTRCERLDQGQRSPSSLEHGHGRLFTYRRHRQLPAGEGADQCRPRQRWSTPATSGSPAAPASASATSPPKARPPATWPTTPPRARWKPPASMPPSIDLIVVGTTTPDLIFPSTACLVQHRLGANGCPAFDVNAACSGFIYALTRRRQVHPLRRGQDRAGHRRRNPDAHGRLDRPRHLRAVRRRRRRGGAQGRHRNRHPVSTHLHADGGKKELLWNPVGVSVGFKPDEPNAGVQSA